MARLLRLNKKVLMQLIPDNQKLKFDKYVSPFINFINSVAGSKTNPGHVGQLTELFEEFRSDCEIKKINPTILEWKKWYLSNSNVMKHTKKSPMSGKQAYEYAIASNWELFKKFKSDLFEKMNEKLIREWVDDLLFNKTFQGLMLQRPIVSFVCKQLCIDESIHFDERLLDRATPEEESIGIDFVYDRNDLEFKFQIKTGQENEHFRKKSNAIAKLPDDVYCCIYHTDKKKIDLIVTYNDETIHKWPS